jgi:hypothetical protein
MPKREQRKICCKSKPARIASESDSFSQTDRRCKKESLGGWAAWEVLDAVLLRGTEFAKSKSTSRNGSHFRLHSKHPAILPFKPHVHALHWLWRLKYLWENAA